MTESNKLSRLNLILSMVYKNSTANHKEDMRLGHISTDSGYKDSIGI